MIRTPTQKNRKDIRVRDNTHVSHASRSALNSSRRFVSSALFPDFTRKKELQSPLRPGFVYSFLAVGQREEGEGEGGGPRVSDTRQDVDEGLTS
jgi:hypothetical protein